LYYRADSSTFIRLDRNDRAAATELEEFLCERKEPGIELVRQILSRTTEDVSFCLNSADLKGMGFPLSIAAAAYLVEQSGGLIQSGTYSWMIPDAQEVRILLELEE